MGQVWQATDTQLNRQVALRILPDAFASDPDRLARFTRGWNSSVLTCGIPPTGNQVWGIGSWRGASWPSGEEKRPTRSSGSNGASS